MYKATSWRVGAQDCFGHFHWLFSQVHGQRQPVPQTARCIDRKMAVAVLNGMSMHKICMLSKCRRYFVPMGFDFASHIGQR